MDYLIETPPEAVVATGASHFNGLEDVAYHSKMTPCWSKVSI
jgi:hypothetical protein